MRSQIIFGSMLRVLQQLLQDTQTYTVRPDYCSELPFIIFTYTPTRPIQAYVGLWFVLCISGEIHMHVSIG
jgi:hypothetical protein